MTQFLAAAFVATVLYAFPFTQAYIVSAAKTILEVVSCYL